MHHTNMVFLIIGNKRKGQVKNSGQTESILCKIMKMLRTNMLKFIVLVISPLNLNCVHSNQVSIITYVLIPNQDMSHVLYVELLVHVLDAYLGQKNSGIQVEQHINNHIIKMSKIANTSLCQVILTTGTSFNFQIRKHPVKIPTK